MAWVAVRLARDPRVRSEDDAGEAVTVIVRLDRTISWVSAPLVEPEDDMEMVNNPFHHTLPNAKPLAM
jgi:hypothetical protein